MPNPADTDLGVVFPQVDGVVSTSRVGREACAAAAIVVDKRLGARIAATSKWREEYIRPFRQLTEISATSADAALAVSHAGLDYLRSTMQFTTPDASIPIRDLQPAQEPALRSVLVTGAGPKVDQLVVPYEGKRLTGDALLSQLDTWVAQGVVEPGFAAAVGLVAQHPEWLDTSDVTVAVLGAGAEMGPAFSLLRWGGRVLAVDLPRPEVWRRLIAQTRGSAGSLEVPVPVAATSLNDDERLAQAAGVDLLRSTPELLELLRSVTGPLVLGNYLYADGGLHVRVSMAADALAAGLSDRPDLMLAFLATPTDAFAVPWRAVEMSHTRWLHRRTRIVQAPLHLVGGFKPNYSHTVTTDAGPKVGIADCLVPQQGPNYALAKRLQRWRAIVAREAGTRVSLNVAPATRTKSVVKNKALAAAYAGAHRFGIRVFEPSTANTLMAAMLVHDLRNPLAAANPEVPLDNPMDLFSAAANHGGLWTTGYEPRSVLGFAAAIGMFESRA